MSKELLSQLNGEQINELERRRILGHYPDIFAETTPVINEVLPQNVEGNLPPLSEDEVKKLLSILRIHVISNISAARREKIVEGAVLAAVNARWVINDGYFHPEVKAEAQRLKTDINNHEYEFSSEMYGDTASYFDLAWRITGNRIFLDEKVQALNQAVEAASLPLANSLANFRLAREEFTQNRSRKNYRRLKAAYFEAAEVSRQREGWERLATVSSEFIVSAWNVRQASDLLKAVAAFNEARTKNSALWQILPRQISKRPLMEKRAKDWQSQTQRDYTSELQLPSFN